MDVCVRKGEREGGGCVHVCVRKGERCVRTNVETGTLQQEDRYQ